jgi:glycosyltransferase involved in cell wall biosynthesis
MRILLSTDAFPPICGGSGWSTYELAKGLRDRGHDVMIIRPVVGSGRQTPRDTSAARPDSSEYEGFRLVEFPAWAPRVPFIRNYFKNERLYRRFETFLRDFIRRHDVDIVHAQHLLTGPPSIAAARHEGVPVVCTIRDYWPLCYWSDLIYDRAVDTLCPGCSAGMMTRCLRPRAGALWPLATPMIPYMRANLALKRRSLSTADAVVAVSTTIANDLRARAPELASTRIEIIPNPVDVAGIRAQAERSAPPMAGAYAVYIGKLEPNKGVTKLLVAIERAQLDWPLVVVGDGSERLQLEAASRRSGRDVRFTGWLPRHDVLAWLRHAQLLIFPSYGPESLSRVLLEASALAIPIAAMDTGGTGDIVIHDETGLLSRSAEALGDDVARLRHDEALRARLGEAARRRVENRFDTAIVVGQVEQLYQELTNVDMRNSEH